jgi:chloramphenicol O-acetyltransferase type A
VKKIDLECWDRREIFDFFSPLSNPFYSVTFRLDVTELYRFCRERGLSFYYTMVFLVTRAVNGTEAFLYTIRGGEVFLLDRREPSFTDRREGEKYFHIVTMPCRGSVEEFCAAAAEKSRSLRGFIDCAAESDELIYLSSLPWLDLSSLTNERDLDPDDAIPRIAWGKYTEENGRRTLGMSVEVNHRFVDGADIGAFAGRLEEMIASL